MSENRPKPYLGNPQETIAVLNRYKFAFQKKFDQEILTEFLLKCKLIFLYCLYRNLRVT